MAAPALDIDLKVFSERATKFFSEWSGSRKTLWGGVDVISLSSPPSNSDDLIYLKSSAVQTWLTSYEFPETIFVFINRDNLKSIHVLCSKSKGARLEKVRSECKKMTGIEFFIHPKDKKEDGSHQMEKIMETIKDSKKSDISLKVGVVAKEKAEGALLEKWFSYLESSEVEKSDVSVGISSLLAIKDEAEIKNVKKAAFLSASVIQNFVVPNLETVIDDEKKMTHEELMESTEEVINNPLKIKVKLNPDNCDICYQPIFQSGGQFDLRASAVNTSEPLYYDQMGVVICALGARYASYCSNVARTYLIDATTEQENNYKLLQKAQEAVIATLKPGKTCAEVYKSAVQTVEAENPELIPFLTKSAGSGIGIEFREGYLALNAKNEQVVKAGMVFNVSLGFQGLKNSAAKDEKAKTYAILLADTVIVRADKPEVGTHMSTKAYGDVGYSFKGEEEDSDEKRPVVREDAVSLEERKAKLRSDAQQDASREEARRKHQQELAEQKWKETARRLKDGGNVIDSSRGKKTEMSDIVAYSSIDDIPSSRELMIQADQKNEAVLLPIYGVLVPFHISTIKTVSVQQDSGHSYIRIIFNVPGGGLSATETKFRDSVYLKEVSFRSSDNKHANQVVQLLKTMGRQIKQRESEKAERATLVTQEKLVLAKGRPVRLSDVWIRPNFGGRGRKLTGVLEAHFNGFRYQTAKAEERVDIMYRNIKHAFFQPAEKEMITLVHFHLENAIMVGTKKTKDIQFFVEVMEANQNVGGFRRSGYDPDEIEEEQRERARKNKINSEFKLFANRVQELWEQNVKGAELEFDVPFRDLGFHGVPHKSNCFVVPTVNCLVELIEMPFFVVTLSEIEIVSLERVGLGQKTFDMRIVFKDLTRDVVGIDAIQSSSIDAIKEWLNSINVNYYESRINLVWKNILQSVLDNPEEFVRGHGWEILNIEGTDSDPDTEDSDAYQPSDAEEVASESEDVSESDDESVVNSDDDDDDGDDDSEEEEEEEGLSWEELEERAKREDREKGRESDSDDEKRKRKMGSRPAPKPGGRPLPPGRSGASSRGGGRPMPAAKRHRM